MVDLLSRAPLNAQIIGSPEQTQFHMTWLFTIHGPRDLRLHMARTLVFNFDGTGNEPSDAGEFAEDESINNVLKLHVLMGGGLESGETDVETPLGEEQRVFYSTASARARAVCASRSWAGCIPRAAAW